MNDLYKTFKGHVIILVKERLNFNVKYLKVISD